MATLAEKISDVLLDIRKDKAFMMAKNYDTNAIDLTIPGCVEYVKDNLYNIGNGYVSLYPELRYSNSTYYTSPVEATGCGGTAAPLNLRYYHGKEIQDGTLRHLTLEEGVKQIGWKTFWGQTRLNRIDFPESLEWVHPDAFRNTAWYDEQPLGEVYCGNVLYKYKPQISQSNTPYVLNKDIVVRPGTKSVSSRAFYGDPYNYDSLRGLRSVTLPDGLIGIGDEAFSYVYNVEGIATMINIPSSVTWIGKNAFSASNCKNLVLPPNLDRVQARSFCGCDFSEDELIIPASVKIIENNAFASAKISNLTINNGVETICQEAFYSNDFVTLDIPDSVKTIENWAFAYNSNLTSISLPASITNMGASIFTGCTNVTTVEVEEGFKAKNLDLSFSSIITVESLREVINNLADRTGFCPAVLTLGATNLAKLTSSEIAVATAKNWTVA